MDLYPNALAGPSSFGSGTIYPSAEEGISSQQSLRDSTLIASDVVCEPTVQPIPRESLSADASVAITSSAEEDEPPPLASGSDSDTDGPDADSGHHSDTSMPSLQSVSDSSDSDVDASESDESEWEDDDRSEGMPNATAIPRSSSERNNSEARQWRLDEEEEDEDDEEDDEYEAEEWEDEEFILHTANGFDLPLPANSRLRHLELIDMFLALRRSSVDNDPVRAETLLGSLEAVPHELVRRYEKLRHGYGDDNDGCAICRDELIQDELEESPVLSKLADAALTSALFEALPFHPSPHLILAFPCPGRHLFHSGCLAPWLARKTTCPSCRFDIDPDSLTLRVSSSTSRYMDGRFGSEPTRKWEPPLVSSLAQWLEQEERIHESQIRGKPVSRIITPVVEHDADDCNADDGHEDGEQNWVETDSEISHSEGGSAQAGRVGTTTGDVSRRIPSIDPALPPPPPPPPAAAARASTSRQLTRLRYSGLDNVLSMLGSGRPSGASAMDLHDTVLEDVFVRALHMARSSISPTTDRVPQPVSSSQSNHDYGGTDQPSID